MNVTREAQRALSDLIRLIPETFLTQAETEIEIIYTALATLELYERTLKEVGTTLFHHGNERQHLVNRLSERVTEIKGRAA